MEPAVDLQFRRLLLGTVVELLRDEGVHADLAALRATFAPETGFRFRWVDNWMRFRGTVTVPLAAPLADGGVERLRARAAEVWPSILQAVGTLPLADPLSSVRQQVDVSATDVLVLEFDFEAD